MFCIHFQCRDVLKCENIVQYFASTNQVFKLLQKIWEALKELERILYIPYLTTVLLQKNEFTLSDFFGCLKVITMKLEQLIAKPGPKHTKLAEKLLHSMNARKSKMIDNPLMLCALYLDPRYKCELDAYPEKQQLVQLTLDSIWHRMKLVKRESAPEIETEVSTTQITNTSQSETMNTFYDELDKHYGNLGLQSRTVDQGLSGANLARDSNLAEALHAYETAITIRMKSSESIHGFWEKKRNEFGPELSNETSLP